MGGLDYDRTISQTARSQARRALQARASCAGRAIGHLDDALVILRTLDDDVYWNMAAAACDAADDLRGRLGQEADAEGLGGELLVDDSRLAPHRAAVAAGLQQIGRLGATTSAPDLVDLARHIVLAPRHGQT